MERKRLEMPSADRSVESVVKGGLCTGCGTCAGVCAESAIQMVPSQTRGLYLPHIEQAECSLCGLCRTVCPGLGVHFRELDGALSTQRGHSAKIGSYGTCFSGYATDSELRYRSSSGGVATALMIFALEEGIVNGALVTRMSDRHPLDPEPFIARTRADILSATGSKYCPVPANTKLREILCEDGKFAVVGLPCQVQGERKAEKVLRDLRERVALRLGLFCGHTPTFHWTEVLLRESGMRKESVSRIAYRGDGWPGGVVVETSDNRRRFFPHSYTWGALAILCWSARCMLCCDHTAELADISLADAWLPEFAGDRLGVSLVVARSERGEEVVRAAVRKGRIRVEEISAERVAASQSFGLKMKKRRVSAHLRMRRVFRRQIPSYDIELDNPVLTDYLECLLLQWDTFISSKRVLWPLLPAYGRLRLRAGELLRGRGVF